MTVATARPLPVLIGATLLSLFALSAEVLFVLVLGTSGNVPDAQVRAFERFMVAWAAFFIGAPALAWLSWLISRRVAIILGWAIVGIVTLPMAIFYLWNMWMMILTRPLG